MHIIRVGYKEWVNAVERLHDSCQWGPPAVLKVATIMQPFSSINSLLIKLHFYTIVYLRNIITTTDVNMKMIKNTMATIKSAWKIQSPSQCLISSIRRHFFPWVEHTQMFVRIVCKPCPQVEEQSVLPDSIFCSEIQKGNKKKYIRAHNM